MRQLQEISFDIEHLKSQLGRYFYEICRGEPFLKLNGADFERDISELWAANKLDERCWIYFLPFFRAVIVIFMTLFSRGEQDMYLSVS